MQGGGSCGDDSEENSRKLHSESNHIFYNDFEDTELSSRSPCLEESPPNALTTKMSSSSTSTSSSTTTTTPTKSSSSSYFSSDDDTSFFSSLLQRQTQLQQFARELHHQWTTGSAKSYAAFSINESYYYVSDGSSSPREKEEELLPFDWVRRVSIGSYPIVACGSAYGNIYVANVESRQLLGVARGVHYPSILPQADDRLEEDLAKCLYGDYDGGGVLAVAMYGTSLVASSGREGGVKIFKLVLVPSTPVGNDATAGRSVTASTGELKLIGEIVPAVMPNNILVTCLKFDSLGRLYMGGQDGYLRTIDLNSSINTDANQIDFDAVHVKPLSNLRHHERNSNLPLSSILSLDISEELDMVATAHANGNVCIYSLNSDNYGNDSNFLGVWNPFRETHARSVAFISSGGPHDDSINNDLSWSIVAGGGNGEIWIGDILYCAHAAKSSFVVNDDGEGDEGTTVRRDIVNVDSIQQIQPNHQGPVLSLATRPGGILVSAGHDGLLRVTQTRPTPKTLYGLGGYKVWLGNVCIDSEGRRLVSDGQDDVVVVHDFSKDDDD